MSDPLFLLADVGGTNTRVGLARGRALLPDTIRRFPNHAHSNLGPVLQTYLSEAQPGPLDGACVAMAGPVAGGRAELTNLDWSIDLALLQEVTGAAEVAILNDLQAQGHAVSHLSPEVVQPIVTAPADPGDTKLVIGVGTGFNAVAVFDQPGGQVVPPSEAGHINLPVLNEDDLRLNRFIASVHGMPAVEDVLSGRGLERVYRWRASEAGRSEALSAAEIMARVDSDPQAREAVAAFIRVLGTVIGNLALVHLPYGGIYLIGGVARAMAPHFAAFGLVDAVRDKGRFAGFMSAFSINLVEDDYAALLGCAAHLSDRLGRLTEN